LAELLGGSLTVDSQPGQGSTFHAAVSRDYTQRQKASGEEDSTSQTLERDSTHARTVLIIDDDEVARYLLQRLLGEASLQFHEAATGPEGLRMAGEVRPAAILLDMSLPGMDGFEVLEALRREPSTRQIPVIIHTSRSLTEQERGRLLPHVVGILSKSGLTREVALELIQRALSSSGHRPGGSSPST
jgi:CheY-like chemotaxis protein